MTCMKCPYYGALPPNVDGFLAQEPGNLINVDGWRVIRAGLNPIPFGTVKKPFKCGRLACHPRALPQIYLPNLCFL